LGLGTGEAFGFVNGFIIFMDRLKAMMWGRMGGGG
jgi:hypothetical protein